MHKQYSLLVIIFLFFMLPFLDTQILYRNQYIEFNEQSTQVDFIFIHNCNWSSIFIINKKVVVVTTSGFYYKKFIDYRFDTNNVIFSHKDRMDLMLSCHEAKQKYTVIASETYQNGLLL